MTIEDEITKSLIYDPESGRITRRRTGTEANSLDVRGYIQIQVKRRMLKGHRVAWFLHHGRWPDGHIDHINRVKSDNRISNLREATPLENSRNHGMQKNNSSGFTGVSFQKKYGTYRAFITMNGRQVNLGSFSCVHAAAAARVVATTRYGFAESHGK